MLTQRGPLGRYFAGVARLSGKLLHHDPIALDFVQIKLNRCGGFRRFGVGRLDLAEDFTLVAQKDNAPAALHPAGELRGAVFLAGAAGRHQRIATNRTFCPWSKAS